MVFVYFFLFYNGRKWRGKRWAQAKSTNVSQESVRDGRDGRMEIFAYGRDRYVSPSVSRLLFVFLSRYLGPRYLFCLHSSGLLIAQSSLRFFEVEGRNKIFYSLCVYY